MARERMTRYMNTAVVAAVFLLAADRLAKAFARHVWSEVPQPLLGDWLSLGFSKNFFISFSIDTIIDPLFIVAPIIIGLLFYLIHLTKRRRLEEASALIFVLLGAASNLYDRIAYGYVIDYIDLEYFTVFNVADGMITIGIARLLWISFRR